MLVVSNKVRRTKIYCDIRQIKKETYRTVVPSLVWYNQGVVRVIIVKHLLVICGTGKFRLKACTKESNIIESKCSLGEFHDGRMSRKIIQA